MNCQIILCALLLTSCVTTNIDLGGQPSGQTEQAKFPVRFFSAEAPDMAKYCSGGQVASIKVSNNFLWQDVFFSCAKEETTKAAPSLPSRKSKRKQKQALL